MTDVTGMLSEYTPYDNNTVYDMIYLCLFYIFCFVKS